ncbi:hypothetical protein DUNSADRAFT_4418 [Dunaliella salina]|uniref:Uncharacterized protein n=1 Tax=Dunaliella salina TaxID=3046 RepID=A0ABQ7GS77_DUNSA|nr:hypothetical protein DUNSADRAFT_4418 [Dunaliella salina]|eukprot:KAF5837438.1 hypothetical protein DUNSADRAFT_4418 [Dunaliella salina]
MDPQPKSKSGHLAWDQSVESKPKRDQHAGGPLEASNSQADMGQPSSSNLQPLISFPASMKSGLTSQLSTESAFPVGPNTTSFTEEDIYTAWKVLCPQGLEQSVMSKSQVLESLRSFFPYMTAREVKDLVGPGNLSTEKLRNLLFHPDVPEFDANVEAFKIVDPHGTGYMDGQSLARLVLQLPGIGYVSPSGVAARLVLQLPGIGYVSPSEDFSTIGSWLPEEIDPDSPNSLLGQKKPSSMRL